MYIIIIITINSMHAATPMASRPPLQIVALLGQVGPKPEDHVCRYNVDKAGTLDLVVDEVANLRHERLLIEAKTVHDYLVHARCMSLGLLSQMACASSLTAEVM
jgi:hypothetical protein